MDAGGSPAVAASRVLSSFHPFALCAAAAGAVGAAAAEDAADVFLTRVRGQRPEAERGDRENMANEIMMTLEPEKVRARLRSRTPARS